MFAILYTLGMFICDLLKSRCRLEAENLFLRHQLNIALRRAPPLLRLRGSDRALLVWMTRLWPSLLNATQVVQPDTILRWHRAGFKVIWRWKSRNRVGRPKIDRSLRDLIQQMSKENRLWVASRIHGELLILGFEVAQSTVSKYMVRPSKPPSQTWKTFLRNHAEAIAAIDMCVVPMVTFGLLFAVCVPRTSSALISRRNRLTSAHHDRAAMFRTGRLGRAIQVEVVCPTGRFEVDPASRCHHVTTNSRWTSPPILQNLIFGTHGQRVYPV